MKKTWKLLAMGVLSVSLLTACNSKATITGETTTAGAGTTASIEKLGDYSEYVTLGQYKGIAAAAIIVTDEDVEARIADMFRDTVMLGDTVNIDYEGLRDGVAFEGGTAQGQYLEIGSGSFIGGFEEGLLGVKTGESVSLNLTFPEVYDSSPELAGQPVVFNVTVNAIEGVEAAQLNEEYVKSATGYATVAEYKEGIREALTEEQNTARMSEVWQTVKGSATVHKYPQAEVDSYAAEMLEYYTQMSAMYGMDVEAMITASGATMEDFNADCQAYGQEVVAEAMILREIARAESIVITEEEYREEMDKATANSGYTEAEILENYGGEAEVRESLLFNKVILFLAEQAVDR